MMTNHIPVLINQILVFSSLLVIGFGAQKLGLMTKEVTDSISNFLVSIVLPAMVLTVSVSGGSREELFQMFPFLICSYLTILVLLLIGWFSGILLRLKEPTKGVHTAVVGFTNNGFIGYPLLLAMFPDTSPLAIAVFILVDTSTLWTIGQILTDPQKGKIDLKKLINPVNASFLIGIVMVLLGIQPDNVFWDTLTEVGGISKYLAMIYIGAVIGSKSLKKLFHRPALFFLMPFKLILGPVCVFFLLKTIGIIDREHIMMLTILSMLPSMVIICILAKNNGSDEDYASGGLLVTTIASLFTMPMVMQFLERF